MMTRAIPRRRRSYRLLGAATLLLCALVVVWPRQARASDGYAQLWGQLTLANANGVSDDGQWGPGLQLGAAAGITDFWSIAGGLEASYHFAEEQDNIPSTEVFDLFAGFRYNLDIFKYVPYLGLSMVYFLATPPDGVTDGGASLGAKATVGVDWRFSRFWSAGAMIELHAPLADPGDFPIYSTLGVNLAYHFRL